MHTKIAKAGGVALAISEERIFEIGSDELRLQDLPIF